MAELKLQTLQHFSTFCGGTVDEIKKKISKKQGGGFGVSYTSLRNKHIRDNLIIQTPTSQIRKCIDRKNGAKDKECNHSVLDAYELYLRDKPNLKAVPIEHRFYSLGRGFLVPVNPVCILIDKTTPKIFWPSFWKTPGKLDGIPSSIFGAIIRRAYFNQAQYDGLDLEFLDLSAPNGKGSRSARIYNLSDFPDLSDKELSSEMEKFLQAYSEVISSEETVKDTKSDKTKPYIDPNQMGFEF